MGFPPSLHPCVESMKFAGKDTDQLTKLIVQVTIEIVQIINLCDLQDLEYYTYAFKTEMHWERCLLIRFECIVYTHVHV